MLSFSGHIKDELFKLSRVNVWSIVAWIGYGFFIPSIITGGNPFGALICFVFGVISFRAWCGRRTIRIILKRESLENYTSRVYLPALWSYAWRSCVTFVTIALILAFASAVTTEERIRAITAFISIWLLSSLFTLDVPFWIRRKVESIVRIQNTHSVSSEVPSPLIRPVLFVALFIVALGFWIVLNKEGSLFNRTPSITAESPPNVTAGGVVATQDQEAHSSRPTPTPQMPDARAPSFSTLNLPQPDEKLAETFVNAEQGDAASQQEVGEAYFSGKGVTKDLVEAVKWFHKAAEQGNKDAQGFLGFAYFRGEGVKKNEVEAAKWLHLAADQGHAVSQQFLAFNYLNGQGVSKDLVEAYKWFKLADALTAQQQTTLESRMTPEQVQEAHKLVREWKPKKAQ